MTVQFLLGRSGTGKTHHCVRAIVDALLQPNHQSLLFLVPEQATFQAQRAILNEQWHGLPARENTARMAVPPGYHRLHVLSFDRLVYLVLGKNTAGAEISRLGRTMVIQRILRDCSPKLKVFAHSAGLPGLSHRLADTITQLMKYANTPEDVANLVINLQKQKNDNLTAAKFADIKIIFEEYLKFIKGKFLDPDIQLRSGCKAITGADLLRGAKLWVDGFAGFTAGELAMLTELLKVVEDAKIALCLDPAATDLANPDKDRIDPVDLFGPTIRTYAELVERIKKCKLKLSPPLILDKPNRFSLNPSLAHIERNIFALKPTVIPAGEKIRIVSAPSARAEVQFVAKQITKLVRQDGYRYRDIAVIASDIDSYENYIAACFKDYGIPAFIDKRRPLNRHPVMELICSALNAVTNDFPANEIFAYLKTDLLCIERGEVDLLENYCVAFGITASDWQSDKPWRYAAGKAERFDEQQVNPIRLKAISPLLQLHKQLTDSVDSQGLLAPGQFTKIIFDFLGTTKVAERLALWVEQSLQRADFAAADEHRQLYDRLVDVFDEMVEAFAGSKLRCDDYIAILRLAFSQMTLAFIPPTLDQVLVGSIERSRHPDLKAAFLIGATERQFPTPIVFDSILSEQDRLTAQSQGLELPPGVRQELANRRYLAYIALTRPSEFLCVTYPSADSKSNAVVRSPFVDDLCGLFNNLKEESVSSDITIEEIYNSYDLEDMLCCRTGETQSEGLLQDILNDEQLSPIGSRVTRAINYENKALLDDEVIRQLFGKHISSSASRLSTFAECPYRHFARYVLDLKKRDEFKLEPLDVGEFFHRALDGFLKRVVTDKVHFETIQPAGLIKILDEEVERLCLDDSFISKFRAHSSHNAFIVGSALEYLRDCVIAVSQMVCAGSFRPLLSEISFGRPALSKAEGSKQTGDSVGEFKIALPDGRSLSLNGRIDRLDVANADGRKVALVFDYKTSESSFSWSQFHYGLDIQLAVYMLAVRNAARKVADDIAGAFYLPIKPKMEEADIGEFADKLPRFAHKARGVFNGEYAFLLDSTAVKDSRFYNFYVTKDGDPYGKYNWLGALRPADFVAFLDFASRKISDLACQIVSGKITAAPYRLNGVSPCSQCEYRPVCRFDWQINNYNLLVGVNKEHVLAGITKTNERKKDR